MKTVSTHQAKTHLSRLIAEIEAGDEEEIVICRGTVPAARLVSASRKPSSRRPRIGTVTSGPLRVADDAFAPLSAEELELWEL